MKKAQQWQQEKGTYFAINKQRKQTYRRIDDGAWEPVDALSGEARAKLEQVGWDRIDSGWFSVFRA